MANEKSNAGASNSVGSIADRTKKAQATRAITQAKLEKLTGNALYAHKKVMACRRSLEALADHIADGGAISPQLLSAIAEVESQAGQCLFAIR